VTRAPVAAPAPAEGRRIIIVGLSRAFVATAVLVALYYLAPLDRATRLPLAVVLGFALVVLLGVTVWWIRLVLRARYPGLRAVEALATTVPLFLLLFAATYFLLARSRPDSFNVAGLTRTDALYFTITVFSTVGFGDIAAASQSTRLLVSAQMVLDVVILGLGIQVLLSAVRQARQSNAAAPAPPREH